MKHLLILFAFFLSANFVVGQDDELSIIPKEPMDGHKQPIDLYEDTLAVLAKSIFNYPMQTKIIGMDTIVINAEPKVRDSINFYRFAACRQFIPTLVAALKIKNSFNHKFSSLKQNGISIQYPADSTFRMFTFQLKVTESEHRYFGAIQMNSPDLKLFPLIDRANDVDEPAYDILDEKNWFGCLVYNLKQIGKKKDRKYLLFGFNGLDENTNRKLIDVLSFEDGKPKFGASIFTKEGDVRAASTVSRFILDYSDQGSITCNYDEMLDLIIFDHLILVSGTNGKPVFTSDGSYEGYEIKKDLLVYKEKLFDHKFKVNEPPRPQPILDSKKKDLFGN